MPRNPKWEIDELILALDLYYQLDLNNIDDSNPAIIELSRLLNLLPIHQQSTENGTFRNPNGVAMKLSNFMRFDPSYQGKGLERGNRLEEVVWDRYNHNREELSIIANRIRETVLNADLRTQLYQIPEETEDTAVIEAQEGKVLYRLHKYYERDASIIRKKKQEVLQRQGKLCCQVCGFDFFQTYGPLGEFYMECHHTKPVSRMADNEKTKLADLALVCANCHRMLHRQIETLSIEQLRRLVQQYQAGESKR